MALLTVLVTGGGMLGGQGDMMMAFLFALVMKGVSYCYRQNRHTDVCRTELDPLEKGSNVNFAVIGRNINLTELLARVEGRLRSALSRFGKKIRHTAAKFEGLTGLRSDVYSQCKVTAFLSVGGKEIVQETGADFHRVINHASDRLERSVDSSLNRMTRLEKESAISGSV